MSMPKLTLDDIQYVNNWTNTPVPYCANIIHAEFLALLTCYIRIGVSLRSTEAQ